MSSNGIVPRQPFIPDEPPTEVERAIAEWLDRADLAVHAFDGQWRELTSYPELNLHLMQRWIKFEDGFGEPQLAVCPIGQIPAIDAPVEPSPEPIISVDTGTAKFVRRMELMRRQGEPIGVWDLVFEALCRAMPGRRS